MSDIVDIGLSVDSRQVTRGTHALDKFGKESLAAERSTSQLNRTLSRGKVLFGAFAAAAVAAGAAYAIKKTLEFEQSIAELGAITGATGKDLAFLRDKSLEFGQTTTQSAVQVATAFKLVASAKPDLLENGAALASVTREVIKLAEAARIDLTTASQTVGGALNQFGADADQAARFVNVLAAGAKFGASEIADTAQALKVAGTVAAGAGLSFEQTTAAIEAMAKVALKGSLAGTGLRGVLLKLSTQSRDEFNPEVVGFTKALQNLAKAELSTAEKKKLFGQESITAANALIKEADALDTLTGKLTGTNTATEQATINTATLVGDFKRLQSAAEGLAISVGTKTNPAIRVFIQGITEIIVGMSKAERESNAYQASTDRLTLSVAETLDTIAGFARDLATPFLLVKEAVSAVINQFIALSRLQFRKALEEGAAGAAAMAKTLADASDPKIVNRFSNIAKELIRTRDELAKQKKVLADKTAAIKAEADAQEKANVQAEQSAKLQQKLSAILDSMARKLLVNKGLKQDILALDVLNFQQRGATAEQLLQFIALDKKIIAAQQMRIEMGKALGATMTSSVLVKARQDLIKAQEKLAETTLSQADADEHRQKTAQDLLALDVLTFQQRGATGDQLVELIGIKRELIAVEEAAIEQKRKQTELSAQAQRLNDLRTLQGNDPTAIAPDNELARLQETQDRKLAMIEDHNALVIQAQINAGMSLDTIRATFAKQEQDREKALTTFKIQQAASAFGQAANFMQNLTVIADKEGGAMFKIMKGFAVAQALMSTFVAANKALELGPIIGPIEAALITISGLARVRQILSTQPGATAGNTVGAGGTTNPGFTGGANNAGPPPVPVNQRNNPAPLAVHITINNPLGSEDWDKIFEENIQPAIERGTNRKVGV